MTAAISAVLAALLFAAATVLQHRSATRSPSSRGAGLRLLAHLTRRPAWLLGAACAAGGLGLHAYALSAGRLVVVQPLLVTGMLFALALDVALERRPASLRESAGGASVVLGLALFLLCAHPAAGSPTADQDVLAAAAGVGVALAVALLMLARWTGARHRAALLATAAGICFGVTGGLLKQVVEQLSTASPSRSLAWAATLLVVVGVLGLSLAQSSYQAGSLTASLPPLTVVDPVVAVLIGAVAFGESLASNLPALLGQTGGLLLVAAGVRALTPRAAATAGPPPGALPAAAVVPARAR